MNSKRFLKEQKDLLEKGGLYVISQPDFVTPKDRHTKVGMANTFKHRFGNSGYSTNYPDGFNVHYLMTAPRHRVNDRTMKSRLHLRERELLKAIHDPENRNYALKPNSGSDEWFTTSTRRDPKEVALDSLKKVHSKRKEASTIFECGEDECKPISGFERKYGRIVDDVVVRKRSTRQPRKASGPQTRSRRR
jgi:hypothetical protein